MKYMWFNTLVKRDHKLYKEYVIGRISGIMYVTCELDKNYYDRPTYECSEGSIFRVFCKKNDYERFAKTIEKLYPGLCEFNCKLG